MIPGYTRLLRLGHRSLFRLFHRMKQVQRSYPWLFGHDDQGHPWESWQASEISTEPGARREELIFPHTVVDALGLFLASVVVLPVANQEAQRLLPHALELAPQPILEDGRHPVLLLFGHQRDVRLNIFPQERMDYLEFLIAVPHVQWKKTSNPYRGPFVYMPRLYLNETWPTILGWFCGYAKKRGRVKAGVDHYHVHSLLGDQPLIEAHFIPRDGNRRSSDFPHFQRLREMFKQPVIGQALLGLLVCTFFDFEFEKGHMQDLEARVQIHRPFVPGLPVETYAVQGIEKDPLGAFRFILPWTLTAPFLPSELRAEVLENGPGSPI